jgi:hypothetical protein
LLLDQPRPGSACWREWDVQCRLDQSVRRLESAAGLEARKLQPPLRFEQPWGLRPLLDVARVSRGYQGGGRCVREGALCQLPRLVLTIGCRFMAAMSRRNCAEAARRKRTSGRCSLLSSIRTRRIISPGLKRESARIAASVLRKAVRSCPGSGWSERDLSHGRDLRPAGYRTAGGRDALRDADGPREGDRA